MLYLSLHGLCRGEYSVGHSRSQQVPHPSVGVAYQQMGEATKDKRQKKFGERFYWWEQEGLSWDADAALFKKVQWEVSPFTKKRLRTCAVVGNGGILIDSSCGKEIDDMDYVFRLNLPPMTITDDIGTKTDFVSANPSILIQKFQKLQEGRKPFAELLKNYRSAMIVLPAFSYLKNTDLSFRAYYTVGDFDLPNEVVFFHPDYLKNLSIFWREKGLDVKRLSSGLMVVSAAMELCSKVTLYGFWPFLEDPNGNTVPHHYYDNIIPKPGFHSMPEEFFFYIKMHVKGALQLKVGQCS